MPNPKMIGFGEPLYFTGAPGLPFNGLPHELVSQALRPWNGFSVGRGNPYKGPVAAGSGGGWVVTDIAGTGAIAAAAGGGFTLTTGSTDENSTQMQFTAQRMNVDVAAAGKKFAFFVRCKVSTAETTLAALGIALVDTTVITAAAGALNVNDAILFYKDATATDFTLTGLRGGSGHFSKACGLTITDDAWMILGVVLTSISSTQSVAKVYAKMDPNDVFKSDPNAAQKFLGDGLDVAAFNHNLVATMVPTFAAAQEGGTTARVLTVDWCFAAEEL